VAPLEELSSFAPLLPDSPEPSLSGAPEVEVVEGVPVVAGPVDSVVVGVTVVVGSPNGPEVELLEESGSPGSPPAPLGTAGHHEQPSGDEQKLGRFMGDLSGIVVCLRRWVNARHRAVRAG
jgi:hypothetical protein